MSGTASRPPGWRHAVVVGGGYGGLLAAGVLADHFSRVSVLEQDLLSADTDYRSGVPQARHPHGLLARGAGILEELFPGLRAELAELGAPIFDLGESGRVMFPSGWAPRAAIGIPIQTFTRVTLERCIRRRVMAHPNVTIRSGVRVDGFCWDRDRSRVTGVRAHSRAPDPPGQAQEIDNQTIDADLVIDASGRTSQLTAMELVEAGFPPASERVVAGDLSYSSRLYHIPPGTDTGWTMALELTYAPTVRRGGSILTVEGRRWMVTLIGAGGETTPTDEAGFLAYARSLRNPHIATSIAAASPAGPLYRAVKLNNRWTLYHQLRRWPERLLCLGDVVCALNPAYGQGMTLAAIQAQVLRDLLNRHRGGNLSGLARTFHRHAARTLLLPWL
ncbi:MAG: FAD-dependent oxidoreductase, partial [Pseudonocardiaceae bacterium]